MTKLINSYLWRLFRNKLLYVGLAAAFIITFAGAGTESSSEQAFLMIKVFGVGIIAFTSVFVPLFLDANIRIRLSETSSFADIQDHRSILQAVLLLQQLLFS